jgi:Ca2+:H+ antiporter
VKSELRCSACEGVRRGEEDCHRCYWDQANALTDPFYIGSVKPFSYICSVFLVTSYVIGLWFSLRTHAAQIWEMPLHGPDFVPPQIHQPPINRSASLANWRDNIPDEPFLKRIGERMSSRFLRDNVTSPTADRVDGGGDRVVSGGSAGTNSGNQQKRIPSNSDRGGVGGSLGSSFTPEDSAQFVRNVAEVAAAAATLAVHHSQSPNTTPQATPRVPPVAPLSIGQSPKVTVPRTPDVRNHASGHDWEVGEQADLAGATAPMGGHDAPNWSRTKSSMILLGATILYAVIAGPYLMLFCD